MKTLLATNHNHSKDSLLHKAYAKINLTNLVHNYNLIQKHLTTGSEIITVIKADAYGHGAIAVAQALTNTKIFAVANILEALELRAAGIMQSIMIMQGILDLEELNYIDKYNLQLVVSNLLHIDLISVYTKKYLKKKKLKVWLKIDSGMHRLGLKEHEISNAIMRLSNNKNIEIIGFMSHFSNSDDLHSNLVTFQQTKQFLSVRDKVKALGIKLENYKITLANSAATLLYPELHYNYVRPGLMLYGQCRIKKNILLKYKNSLGLYDNAITKITNLLDNLKPVMCLYARVIAIKSLSAGDGVGYGQEYIAQKKTKIAIVGMGYADGYPRELSKDTTVYLNSKYYKVVGSVSMDSFAIDIGYDLVEIGSIVELFGSNLSVDTLAKNANTISYTIFTGLGKRVNKKYIK